MAYIACCDIPLRTHHIEISVTLKSRGLMRLNVQGIHQGLSTESKPVVFSKSTCCMVGTNSGASCLWWDSKCSVLHFIHQVQLCKGYASSMWKKVEAYNSDKHTTNIKYKLEYFDCFPSNTSTFYQAFIGAYLLQTMHYFLVTKVYCTSKDIGFDSIAPYELNAAL